MTTVLIVDDIPPPLSPGSLLLGWAFQPLLHVPILIVAGLYIWGMVRAGRQGGRRFPPLRACSFLGGLALLLVTLTGPFDAYADVS
ncbi:MAG: cytochrome c oxidase assembly protein, partial [Sciscionella sp.]